MAIRDLLRNISVAPSLAPAARTSTAEGEAVDLRGFDAAVVAVSFGAYTDGTHTPSLQHSMDGVSYTAVSAGDLDGAFEALSSTTGQNDVQLVGYVGSQRYLRVVMTVSGASSGAVSAANVLAGYPHQAPVQ